MPIGGHVSDTVRLCAFMGKEKGKLRQVHLSCCGLTQEEPQERATLLQYPWRIISTSFFLITVIITSVVPFLSIPQITKVHFYIRNMHVRSVGVFPFHCLYLI